MRCTMPELLKKIVIISILPLILCLSACDLTPGVVIRVGIAPYWQTMDLWHAKKAWQQTLGRKSGYMVQIVNFRDIASVENALAKGKIDLAILDPAARCRFEADQSIEVLTHFIPYGEAPPDQWYALRWLDMPAGDSAIAPQQPDTTRLLLLAGQGYEGCPQAQPTLPQNIEIRTTDDPRELFRQWLRGEARQLVAPGVIARQMDFSFSVPDSTYTITPVGAMGTYTWVIRRALPQEVITETRKLLSRERGPHILDPMGVDRFAVPEDSIFMEVSLP